MKTQATTLKKAYRAFAKVAVPYTNIADEKDYERALLLIEELLQEAEDSDTDPLNGLIELLSQAVARYEDSISELSSFEQASHAGPADVAMLRLLMDQHGLGGADFPEIGDKTLVSKILSGERNLTKKHIQKLAKRFSVNPALFF